jgi:glutamine synthetase
MFEINYAETQVSDIYGCDCFTETEMSKHLNETTIKQLKEVQRGYHELTPSLAEAVAAAMKEWALKKGATHYCHWFQPLTGLTAEKHDSFIVPTKAGKVLLEFSGKELIKGEGDASSLPSGGLRTTFEARGYTAWDTSSPAFIKEIGGEKILYIPTAFFSYTGAALDKKVPLLRSTQALEKQTLRVLAQLGKKARRIIVNIGPEQEYFLVDKEYYEKRPDLRLAGRTVLGTFAAKGQELDDHYYGRINDKVSNFMLELNAELWRLGISSKTQHMEAAPNQFEIAVVYDAANIATDHNQLVMEVLQSVALRHGMVALLHEKPFAGVNGSGKHDNWSISTDDGTNLLSPGSKAEENMQFLLILTSFLKAVDEYAPLIRCGAATAGNDFRLGGLEAPPAVISVFLGEQLTGILEDISNGKPISQSNGSLVKMGVFQLPQFPKDLTDRNRTSPMAFTGNKFEFRMVGSSQSMSGPNIYINTVMADVLEEVADRLEKATDKKAEVHNIIKEFYRDHKRIIFNGNGYGPEWVAEAKRRGLVENRDTVSALPEMVTEKSLSLFERQGIFSREEVISREEIYLDTFSKQVNIEAAVLNEMVGKTIIPAVTKHLRDTCQSIKSQQELGLDTTTQMKRAENMNVLLERAIKQDERLHISIAKALAIKDTLEKAQAYRDDVRTQMEALRGTVDALENITDKSVWPYPSYDDLLFRL